MSESSLQVYDQEAVEESLKNSGQRSFDLQVIEEFRANAGKVGGFFEDSDVVLLTTTGAKSGLERLNPLVYFTIDDRTLIVASKGGAPTHPDWYHNIVANPQVTVEIGAETFQATAVELTGADRDKAFAGVVALAPNFGEYQEKTTRILPVIELQRI